MNILIITFGCTVNNYESQELARELRRRGDAIVERGEADVVIVNSCVVTGTVEKGVAQLIERQRKKLPAALIILIGCYNEYLKQNGKGAAAVDGAVMLDKKKPDLAGMIHEAYIKHKRHAAQTTASLSTIAPATNSANTPKNISPRALVQIQNGCDCRCAYCVVPHVRGGSVSRPLPEILRQTEELTREGACEIVLAGMNLGQYAYAGAGLTDVITQVSAVPGVDGVRLSSLEPMYIDDAFMDLLPDTAKLRPHLHISLQSGCDRTLARMNRRYSFADYHGVITRIRRAVPDIAITTDVIVGFPGESEGDFNESIANIVACGFSDIHIFKFSPRRGTEAAAMDQQAAEPQKSKRALVLRGVKLQARYNYYSRFIGTTDIATLLRRTAPDGWEGATSRNYPIIIPEGEPPISGIAPIEITGMAPSQDAYTGILHYR